MLLSCGGRSHVGRGRRPVALVAILHQWVMRVRRLRRNRTGVKPIIAVGRGRRVPTSGGCGGGSSTTFVAAAATTTVAVARHRLRPVGSASAVPGPFLADALSLGRTARRLVLLYLFVLLRHQCL